MAQITLKLGEVQQVKVTRIERLNVRQSFTIKNVTHYNFVIHVEMKDGRTGWVEYVSTKESLELVPFFIGVVQYIKCNSCNGIHCTVEPYDPEEAIQSEKQPDNTSKEDAARMLVDKSYRPEQRGNSQTVSVNGNSFMMCLSYAKDLKVAEIRTRTDAKITSVDIDDIIYNAGKLNDAVIDKLKKQSDERL